MKFPLIFFIAGLLSQQLSGFGQNVNSTTYDLLLELLLESEITQIAVEQTPNDALFIDARTIEEYDVSHIKGALHINSPEDPRLQNISKNKTIIVYCSIGLRSESLCEELKTMGFNDVYNLYGGIFEWVNDGRAIYNHKGPTLEVHGYNYFWAFWLDKGTKVY